MRGSSDTVRDTVRDNDGDGGNDIEGLQDSPAGAPLFCLHVVGCERIGDDGTSATQPSNSSSEGETQSVSGGGGEGVKDMEAGGDGGESGVGHLDMAGLQVTSKNTQMGTPPGNIQRSPGIDTDLRAQHVPGMMPADVAACEGKSRDGAPPTSNGSNLREGGGEEPAAPPAPPAPPLKSHWKKVKKADRAARFVDHVIKHLGIGRLGASPVGVLDVAGGSGCVAFELSFRHHIPCTTIDPRGVRMDKKRLRNLKFREVARDRLRPGMEMSPLARHLYDDFAPWTPTELKACFSTTDFLPPLATAEMVALVERSTAIIGMHPDEATDPIMDVAIAMGKPWAIVRFWTNGHCLVYALVTEMCMLV